MIEFIAGCEFVAILVLATVVYCYRNVCAAMMVCLMQAERRCRLWRDHYESLAWTVESADSDDVRTMMSAADSRIAAELREP